MKCTHGYDCELIKCPLGFPGCLCADELMEGETTIGFCDASIRPMRPYSDAEVTCGLTGDHRGLHEGVLRDYLRPGSATIINWTEQDRRNYRGAWPGDCPDQCILPAGHRRGHEPPR